MEQLGSHWTKFYEIWYLRIFRKSVEKIQVSFKSDKANGYFTWRPIYIFLSRSLLIMKNVSDKSCRENLNTHFIFGNFFFESHALYEIMWKDVVERGRSQMTIWRMRIACWIPRATNRHSDCVIQIAFPLQQWLHELSLMLRCTHTAVMLNLAVHKILVGLKRITDVLF